jgi:lipopolysaccharide/colanic/teichoic acid biosynthesis glycosyltransferase
LTLFVVEALLIFACYAAIPYLQGDGDLFLFYESGWQQIAIAEGVILFVMYLRHLYEDVRVLSRIVFLQQLSMVIGVTFIVEALISYWNIEMALPRGILIMGSVLALVAVFVSRVLFSLAMRNRVGGRRLLFIGLSPIVVQLAAYFRRHPEFGLLPIGYLDQPDAAALPDTATLPDTAALPDTEAVPDVDFARLGPVAELPGIMAEYRPDWIVVARQGEIEPRWLDDFIELRFAGLHTEQVASLYETALGRVCSSEIQPDAFLYTDTLEPNPFNLKLQSFYSKLVALAAISITLPLMAVLLILVKATSRGPLLAREKRVGKNGEPFIMYRFCAAPRGGRATGTRRLLAGLLDAYPQFWNVLRGEMSIVGPSPDRPEFAARLNQAIPFHAQRTAVKPGMTGWAQIHASRLGLPRDAMGRLEYDLYYVKNLSPSLDLSVMLRWLRETLTPGGFAAA